MSDGVAFSVIDGNVQQLLEAYLSDIGFSERQDLQCWIDDYPEIRGPDLLIVTTEFDRWEFGAGRVRDRLDVLILDLRGSLIVAELKRGEAPDTLHGPRGAAQARELRADAFDLKDTEMERLEFACQEHTNGGVSLDPMVGVCWDADRLNLWGVGIRPDPRWLSTEAARSGERIGWARNLQWERLSWEELCQSFDLR